jgi:hypothetical protein
MHAGQFSSTVGVVPKVAPAWRCPGAWIMNFSKVCSNFKAHKTLVTKFPSFLPRHVHGFGMVAVVCTPWKYPALICIDGFCSASFQFLNLICSFQIWSLKRHSDEKFSRRRERSWRGGVSKFTGHLAASSGVHHSSASSLIAAIKVKILSKRVVKILR